jgi:hypothetical protein
MEYIYYKFIMSLFKVKREKELKFPARESNPRTSDYESDALSITPSIHSYKNSHLWYIYSKLRVTKVAWRALTTALARWGSYYNILH